MTRVKGGKMHSKRRRNILKATKGYKWGRKNRIKLAKVAKIRAGQFAYVGRKNKKRTNRGLWLIRINAAVRELGLSYSKFMDKLKKAKMVINRKVLSDLAKDHPKIFTKIVESVK